MRVYTIGHSTRSLEEFVSTLAHYGVELVVDVRRFPGSRKFPHFSSQTLENELAKAGIRYVHFPQLGGFRKGGYLAFTQTEEFREALGRLRELIGRQPSAIMCAEIYYGRCHRRYISDALQQLGYAVVHIYDKRRSEGHRFIPPEQLKIFCDKKAEKLESGVEERR